MTNYVRYLAHIIAKKWHGKADDTEMKRCYNNTVNQWVCNKPHFYYAKKERVKMKYCPYCGADIPDGAVSFCAECGKALPAKKEKAEKSTPVKKSSAGKKKKQKSLTVTDAELRKTYNDGYDGYYEDLLPVDHGKERFETDSAPIKKIIVLAIGVLVVIGLCVLMLYFV